MEHVEPNSFDASVCSCERKIPPKRSPHLKPALELEIDLEALANLVALREAGSLDGQALRNHLERAIAEGQTRFPIGPSISSPSFRGIPLAATDRAWRSSAPWKSCLAGSEMRTPDGLRRTRRLYWPAAPPLRLDLPLRSCHNRSRKGTFRSSSAMWDAHWCSRFGVWSQVAPPDHPFALRRSGRW